MSKLNDTPKTDLVIPLDKSEVQAAYSWHGGQNSMLYAAASTGALELGTTYGDDEQQRERFLELASRLEVEASRAASLARNQAEKVTGKERRELLADAETLEGLADKATSYAGEVPEPRGAAKLSAVSAPGIPKALWQSYLVTALWSSNHSAGDDNDYPDPRGLDDGDPYDSKYDPNDFDEESLEKMAALVRKFLAHPGVEEAIVVARQDFGQDDSKVGHDLWLTQAGHGAGFWDGDYGDDEDPNDPAGVLTKAAKKTGGEMNLMSYQPEGTEDPDDARIEFMR